MKKFRNLIVAAVLGFATPVMITGCVFNKPGVEATQPGFNEVLAQSFQTVEVVSNLVSGLVVRDRISIAEAEKIEEKLTNIVDQLITVKELGETVDSKDKLNSIANILRELERTYTINE